MAQENKNDRQGVSLSDEEIHRIADGVRRDTDRPIVDFTVAFANAILSRASSSRAEVEIPEGYALVPKVPTLDMLSCIVHIDWPNDQGHGREQQRKYGLYPHKKDPRAVPPKSEYECAVGQYIRMLATAEAPNGEGNGNG